MLRARRHWIHSPLCPPPKNRVASLRQRERCRPLPHQKTQPQPPNPPLGPRPERTDHPPLVPPPSPSTPRAAPRESFGWHSSWRLVTMRRRRRWIWSSRPAFASPPPFPPSSSHGLFLPHPSPR